MLRPKNLSPTEVRCSDCGLRYYSYNPTSCIDCSGALTDPDQIPEHDRDEEYTFNRGHGARFKEVRESVLERDGYQCVICGLTHEEHRSRDDLFPPGGGLHVHHFNPTRSHELERMDRAHAPSNLASLCDTHHMEAERGLLSSDEIRLATIS